MTTPANTDLAGAVERVREDLEHAELMERGWDTFEVADLRLILTALASKEDQGSSSAKSAARGPSDLMGSTAPCDLDDGAPVGLIRRCPSCGSGDVRWCRISVRPYCAECSTWGVVNFGTPADAVREWNAKLAPSSQTEAPQPVHDEPKSSDPEGAEVEAVALERVEMVDWSYGYEQAAEPIWRIIIGGYCADFETETAAANFRNAILDLSRRPAPVPEDVEWMVGTLQADAEQWRAAGFERTPDHLDRAADLITSQAQKITSLETQEAAFSHFVNEIQRALGDGPDGSNLEVLAGAVKELRKRLERAEAALRPFAAIKPSSFYPEDGSEGERYQVICNMNGSGDFGGEDLARARSYFTQGGETS